MAEKTADLQKDIDTIKQEFAQLRSDMSGLIGTLKQTGSDSASAAADRGREEVRRRADDLSRAYGSVREGAEHTYANVHQRLEEYPLTGIAVAFGVGFVVGNLMSRK